MNRIAIALLLCALSFAAAAATTPVAKPAAAATPPPLERQLEIKLDVDATQNWRNQQQWSRASTQQHYQLRTRLRSDGRLYHENLLEPDLQQRVRIKSEYYTYQGLLQLRRDNGGQLPDAAQAAHGFGGQALQQHHDCVDAADCPNAVAERYAAISALQNNTLAELEEFIATYDQAGGTYRYFFGYAGCPNRMRLQHRAHFEGEQAYDRDKKKLQPFSLDWTADSNGSADEQARLCQRYVVTLDTGSGAVYLENAFIPSARGAVVSVLSGNSEQRQADLPLPSEVMRWLAEQLDHTPPLLKRSATLHLNRPLDGNATVLGLFDGTAKVDLSWSFTEH
jgi:hypothetical protein